MAASGIDVLDPADARSAKVVVVLHVDEVSLPVMEAAAWAVIDGARFLTGNKARAYAGATGPILSRGAMCAAAIAKASGKRPTVVGKPSKPAVDEVASHLGVPASDVVFVGDDLRMDVALGHVAKARTVLVESGISGGHVNGVAPSRRPEM